MALRTFRVSLSPSTRAWHSRFSFSGKGKKRKRSWPGNPDFSCPTAAGAQQTDTACSLRLQAARSWLFLQRAISLSAVCTRDCTEQLLLPVPAGFKIFFTKDNKFPLIAFQCQPCIKLMHLNSCMLSRPGLHQENCSQVTPSCHRAGEVTPEPILSTWSVRCREALQWPSGGCVQ